MNFSSGMTEPINGLVHTVRFHKNKQSQPLQPHIQPMRRNKVASMGATSRAGQAFNASSTDMSPRPRLIAVTRLNKYTYCIGFGYRVWDQNLETAPCTEESHTKSYPSSVLVTHPAWKMIYVYAQLLPPPPCSVMCGIQLDWIDWMRLIYGVCIFFLLLSMIEIPTWFAIHIRSVPEQCKDCSSEGDDVEALRQDALMKCASLWKPIDLSRLMLRAHPLHCT